jgi:hypothetical protein
MSPQQTLWLSPQQTLWLCLHIKHCGYVSTTNTVAMSPQQTLWHNVCCGDSHNVCCGDIATMFDVET